MYIRERILQIVARVQMLLASSGESAVSRTIYTLPTTHSTDNTLHWQHTLPTKRSTDNTLSY